MSSIAKLSVTGERQGDIHVCYADDGIEITIIEDTKASINIDIDELQHFLNMLDFARNQYYKENPPGLGPYQGLVGALEAQQALQPMAGELGETYGEDEGN